MVDGAHDVCIFFGQQNMSLPKYVIITFNFSFVSIRHSAAWHRPQNGSKQTKHATFSVIVTSTKYD